MLGYKRFRISADTWPIQKAKEKQSSRNWETQQEVGKTLFISLPPPTAAAEEATAEEAAAEEAAVEEAAATLAAAPSIWVKGDQNWNMKTNKASNPVDGSQLLQQKPSGNSGLKREKSPAKGEGQADRHRFQICKTFEFRFSATFSSKQAGRGEGAAPALVSAPFHRHMKRVFSAQSVTCPLLLVPRVPFCPLAYL